MRARTSHHDTLQRQFDALADAAWNRMDDARGTDMFEVMRDFAFAAKDRADQFAREH